MPVCPDDDGAGRPILSALEEIFVMFQKNASGKVPSSRVVDEVIAMLFSPTAELHQYEGEDVRDGCIADRSRVVCG